MPVSTSKVECCHFSSDGKLLATGGHDKKVITSYTDVVEGFCNLHLNSSGCG